jgi:hypothetical protein
MNENIKYFAGAVAVVGLSVGAVIYRDQLGFRPAPPEKPAATMPARPAVPPEPAIKHPLPASQAQEPLPKLDESDAPIQDALAGVMGKESVERFIVTKDLVRHIVVSIDNLPDQKVAERLRPMQPTPGKFAVSGSEEAPVLDPANYERYKPLVQMIGSIDTKQLVTSYTRYYPLFQDAYESLGHPPQYFNDRLVEVIDHLLATPDIRGPVALVQPNVLYQFADPRLESRSAGQKLLIRMGSDNATAVKAKLRELRAALLAQKPTG